MCEWCPCTGGPCAVCRDDRAEAAPAAWLDLPELPLRPEPEPPKVD
ncbi:MAG TPA: hypothetical protein VEX86_20925 [Longimicrobium sp.]|nr:hypothetical protein [Longimicrobium sp.]